MPKPKVLRVLKQKGQKAKSRFRDSLIEAFKPGKRRSGTGNIYWETRPNRSDRKPSKKPPSL